MKRLIAYLGILASIILGGILGLFASVLAIGVLQSLGVDFVGSDIKIMTGIALGASIGGILAVIRVRRYLRKQREERFAKYLASVPENAGELIKSIIRQMRYRKEVRQDVQAELTAHFEDGLKDCKSDEEKEQKAQQLIADFGDVKLLAVLLRRAKKRCRPLWRTVVTRAFQTIGILILCFIIYTGWFLTGEPTISVDYLALWNQMNRPQVADVDNAWPHYEKAISLFVEPNKVLKKMDAFKNYRKAVYRSFSKLTEQEQKTIGEWIEQNESARQEFVAGSDKAYCYREHKYYSKDKERWLRNVLLPHLTSLRYLTILGIWRSKIEVEQGQIQQGIEDCLVLARVGRHLQGNRTSIVEQWAGLNISNLASAEILNITATRMLSAIELNQLQQQLSQIYPQGYPPMDIEGERLMFIDVIQHVFTEGGPGGGHLIPKLAIPLMDYKTQREDTVAYIVGSLIHARRNETVAKGSEVFDKLSKLMKMSPYERHAQNLSREDIISALPSHRYFLLPILVPASDRLSQLRFEGKALYEATVTALALERWWLERNEYPADLDELVTAGYLNELPMDPYSNQPLVYKRTDDDFVLYSVGPNFIDDDGKMAYNKEGKPRWRGTEEDGDTVFWPVRK